MEERIQITETTVECPVKNCDKKVERQKGVFKREEKFKCPKHNIYISPSTFEYENELRNLLWKDKTDLDFFNKIKKVKRESRIARDNSEDALTWNVFRFLERNKLLCEFLQNLIHICEDKIEIIYWSYSQSQESVWDMSNRGREEFELVHSKGSEPDVIILGDKNLIFIEAKFCANNETIPYKLYVEDKYVSGGNGRWNKVFRCDFKTVAAENKKYELSRFWLIGSWIAKQLHRNFYLINITLSKRGENIEEIFKKHIVENNSRIFKRITWEQIYGYISNSNFSADDKKIIIRYFKNKSMGYDSNGILQHAFSIS
ncbi:MAG TPA: hypothetical protein PKX93_01235 [bacterium]|nr:hypothetical protein [bacterium]HOL66066.1 hypothetical protein [bacterium]HPP11411.1 hypothetical protein [bacterium]